MYIYNDCAIKIVSESMIFEQSWSYLMFLYCK